MPQNPRQTSDPEIDRILSGYVRDKVNEEADRQGVPRDFAQRIANTESAYKPDVIKGQRRSSAGAIGPMQLMPGTAKDLKVDPYNVNQNISGGVGYAAQQLKSFGNDQRKASAAYNWGPGNVRKYGTGRAPAETQNYMNKVAGQLQQSDPEIENLLKQYQQEKSVQPAAQPSPDYKTRNYPPQYMGSETDPAKQRADKANWSRGFSTNFDIEQVGPGSTVPPDEPRRPSTTTRNVFNKNLERDQRAATTQAKSALDFRPAGGNVVRLEEQAKGVTRRVIASPQDAQRMAQREQYQRLSPTQRLATRVAARLGGASPQDIEATARPVTDIEQAAGSFGRGVADVTGSVIRGVPSVVRNPYMPTLPNQGVAKATDELGRRVERTAQAIAPVNPDNQGWLTTKIPRAAGGVVPFVAGGMATGGGSAAPAVMGALASAGQYRGDVAKSGQVVSPGRYAAGEAFAVATGLTEALGIGRMLNKMGVAKLVIERAAQILEESGQEYAQAYLEDINAKLVAGYDQSRSLSPTDPKKLEGAALGAILGGGMAAPSLPGDIRAQRAGQFNAPPPTVAPMAKGSTEPLTPPAQQPNAPSAAPAAAAPVAPVEGAPDRATYDPGAMGEIEYQRDLKDFHRQQARAAKKAPAKPQFDPAKQRQQVINAQMAAQEAESAGNYRAAAPKYKSALDTLGQMRADAKRQGNEELYTSLSEEMDVARANMNAARKGQPATPKAGTKLAPESPQVQQAQAIKPDILPDVNAPTRSLSGELPATREAVPPLMRPDAVVNPEGGIPPARTETEELQLRIDQDAAKRQKVQPGPKRTDDLTVAGLIKRRLPDGFRVSDEGERRTISAREEGLVGLTNRNSRNRVEDVAHVLNEEGFTLPDGRPFVEDGRVVAGEGEILDFIRDNGRGKVGGTADLDARLAAEEADYHENKLPTAELPRRTAEIPRVNMAEKQPNISAKLSPEDQPQQEFPASAVPDSPLNRALGESVTDEAKVSAKELGLPSKNWRTPPSSAAEVQKTVSIDDITLGRDDLSKGRMRGVANALQDGVKTGAGVDPIKVVPDPDAPGKYVVSEDGNHRVALLKLQGFKGDVPVTAREVAKAPDAETDAEIRAAAREYGQRPVEDPQYTEAPPTGRLAQTPHAQLAQTTVKDRRGKPLLMYHGTSSAKGFDQPSGKSWFTSSPEYGSQYAEGAHLGGVEGPSRVYPTYLDIRNPYRVKDRLEQVELVNDSARIAEIEQQGYDGVIRTDEDGKVIALPFRDNQVLPAMDAGTRAAVKAQPLTPFRPPTPAGPRIVGNRPTPKDVNINARFPSARRAMATAGKGVQAEIDAGRADTGQYGRNAQQMFKSSSGKALHGQDSFFHDAEVKGKLGLSRDAEQKDVRAAVKRQLARFLRIKADEVSLTQVAPDVWRRFADVKALSKDARAKMELAFMRAEGESSGKQPEPQTRAAAEVPRAPEAANPGQSAKPVRQPSAGKADVGKDAAGATADRSGAADGPVKIGDYYTFTEPAIVYEAGQPKTIQKKVRGRVVDINSDGSIGLKRQDGGYSTKTPAELGLSGDVVKTPPIAEPVPVKKSSARSQDVKAKSAAIADSENVNRGTRRATPEGAAKVEAARQAMEDAIRRNDYTKPGERADAIAAAREAVQEAQAEAHVEAMKIVRETSRTKSVELQLAAVDEELAAGVIDDKQAKAKREAIERRNAPKSAVREFIADEGGSASLGLGLENVGKVLRKVRDAQSFGEIPLSQRRANLLTWHKEADRRLKAADGTPLTVYHGTPSAREITKFQKDKADLSGWLAGFFFTENPQVASEIYSVHGRMASEENRATKPGVTYPVHLNIKRPFDFDAPIDDATHDKLTAAADKVLGDGAGQGLGIWLDRYGNNGGGPDHTLVKYVESVLGRKEQAKRGLALTRLLKTAGYDGGTHMGANDANVGNEQPHRAWISFEPAQIKSAIGNRGTFSPETGDITTMFGGQKILDNLRAGRRPQKKKEFPPDFDSTKWMKKALTDFGKQTLSDEDKAKLADPKLTDVERRKILMSAKVDPQAEAALLTHLTDALNAADTGDYTAFQDAALWAKAIYDAPATIWEKASAVRKAAMLSRPVSHLRNILGNTAFLNLEEAARVPGSLGDMLMGGITGRRTLQGASAGDSVRAIYESATGGVQAAKDAMKGRSSEEIAKALQTKEVHFNNKIVDKSVKFIFRSLGAEDQFFFVGAYDRAIREAAKLTARNEARQGIIKRTDIKARQDALLAAPTSQMEIDATLAAETAVFRNDNPISSAISRAREGASDKANFALDLVLPFDRTPTNVVLRALEYSPIGVARGLVKGAAGSARAARARYKAKKAGTPSRADIQATIDKAFTPAQQRSAAQLLGRGLTGTGLMALGYALAEKGLMTGFYDDDDYKTEAKKRAVGAQPLAIQIKGRWYGLQGIGPIGMGLGMGATMYDEATKKGGDKIGGAARSAYASATEAPLLSSLKDLAKDAEQVKRDRANIGKLAGNLAASFVPGFIGDIGQAIPYVRDPNERQVKDDPKKVTGARRAVREGFGQIGAKIPGVRRMLPVKKDANGKPVTTEYPDFIDPFNSRPATGNLPQRKKGASRPFIPPAPRR